MNSNHASDRGDTRLPAKKSQPDRALHPAWKDFMEFCLELRFGEVERLVIQDGLPVLAEMTKKKVKFARDRE